ncbi:MAG: peptide chain release factor 2 [Bdellovibrionales bacterium]|nr:peptide chain release factor 2 [Bdellovibrionales bacterium]
MFDIDRKRKRLDELENQSQNPEVWNNHKEMQKINQEKVLLERETSDYDTLLSQAGDAQALLEMVVESQDEDLFKELKSECTKMAKIIDGLEVKSLLSGSTDIHDSYMTINSGAGGTEAQDWAEILLRMYLRYAERQGFKTEVLSINQGEEAGIKSVTLLIQGPYAFGYLKAENGVHRLVRISPFDSNARRHTSFASITVWPEVDDDIEVVIKDEDLNIDTYRASGAGGQHVNKTDSAVRITHKPSGIIIACQNQRSQHANRDRAMKMLKAALYEIELKKLQKEKEDADAQKKANEWGSQIRSYVLHPYQLVKDHRTNWESSQPSQILDGDLSEMIQAYLKHQVAGQQKSEGAAL